MRAIVALGNPGPQYAVSRHNAGFLLADILAEQWSLPRFQREAHALVTEGERSGAPFVLAKPMTYMNRSGRAVAALRDRYSFEPARDLLVVVDDWALPLGTFRLRARGSAGGHHGLESIEQSLGSPDYARLRIGIGPRPDDIEDPTEFVLQPFSRAELTQLADLMPDLADAVACWLDEGIETAMNRFNRRGLQE